MDATVGIEFATVSLKDALDLAVLIEEEARDRYGEFADHMDVHHAPEAASFFRFMADNEEKHRCALAMRRHGRFGDAPAAITRAMLVDVEAPNRDEARPFMTVHAALATALRSEKKAHAFFVAALLLVEDADVRGLFDELRREEIEHENLVRRQLAAMETPVAVTADDPVDH